MFYLNGSELFEIRRTCVGSCRLLYVLPRCPFLDPLFNLPDCKAGPCQKYIRGLVLSRTGEIHSDSSPSLSLILHGWVKKCEIWPRFATQVAFDKLWYQTEHWVGSKVSKMLNMWLESDDWPFSEVTHFTHPTFNFLHWAKKCKIWYKFGLWGDPVTLQCMRNCHVI